MSDQGGAAPAAPGASAEAPVTESQEIENTELGDAQEIASEDRAVPNGDTKAAPKAVKDAAKKVDAEKVPGTQKYKLVIDGQEEELSQEQLVQYAQKAKAADKRFQESAQIRKEALELVQMLRNSPERVLADPAILGSDEKVVEFAKQILARQMEESQKPADVRAKEKAERELQELRDQIKREAEERQKTEYENMVKQHETQLEEQIQDAMESSGLPKSPYVLKRLADVMISSLEFDKEITPKQAMNIVKREMQKDMKEYFNASPDDLLEELLGDNMKRLRKRQVAKIKAETIAPSASQIKQPAIAKDAPKPASDKISMKKWLRG